MATQIFFIFTLPGEMIQILTNNIFQTGWFNHLLVRVFLWARDVVFNHLKWEHNIQNAVKMRGVIHLVASLYFYFVTSSLTSFIPVTWCWTACFVLFIAKGEEVGNDRWVNWCHRCWEGRFHSEWPIGYKWEGNHRSWCFSLTNPVPRFPIFSKPGRKKGAQK